MENDAVDANNSSRELGNPESEVGKSFKFSLISTRNIEILFIYLNIYQEIWQI